MSTSSKVMEPPGGLDEADGGTQQRGLAGAVVAHHRDDTVGGHLDVDPPVEDLSPAISGMHSGEFQHLPSALLLGRRGGSVR